MAVLVVLTAENSSRSQAFHWLTTNPEGILLVSEMPCSIVICSLADLVWLTANDGRLDLHFGRDHRPVRVRLKL